MRLISSLCVCVCVCVCVCTVFRGPHRAADQSGHRRQRRYADASLTWTSPDSRDLTAASPATTATTDHYHEDDDDDASIIRRRPCSRNFGAGFRRNPSL